MKSKLAGWMLDRGAEGEQNMGLIRNFEALVCLFLKAQLPLLDIHNEIHFLF